MLEIKNVSRVYKTDEIELKALDSVSVNLRRNEFVAVLGPSGSGKTTLLNIIGGLDHYTSGDMIIDGTSTKEYTSQDWDTYRNHRVGFVFQSYNLIGHQSILSNVELALTLSGVSGGERKRRAAEALKKVGLEQHMNKRPNQLSGGQMQRVAIARALVNNPDIVLADEPTGALDSKTSVQIMDLLKEIAKDKLVVMVTHNPELAKQYSTRIITLKDGQITHDSKPFDGKNEAKAGDKKKHTSLSLRTALQLSKNNLMTKRGRTLLTAIAGSIGIIGIALILALANGVNKYADGIATGGSVASAITVQRAYSSDSITVANTTAEDKTARQDGSILAKDDLSGNSYLAAQQQMKYNDMTALKTYIDAHRDEMKNYTASVVYSYGINLNIYDKGSNGEIFKINPVERTTSTNTDLDTLLSGQSKVTTSDLLSSSFKEIISNDPYEVLSGSLPENDNELLLVVNDKGELQLSTLYSLNLASLNELNQIVNDANVGKSHTFSDVSMNYDKIVGKTYKVTLNDTQSYDEAYTLKVVGVAKVKNENDSSGYMGYTHKLIEKVIENSNGTINVDAPETIAIYAKSNNDKKKVTAFLDQYNNQAEEAKKVHYADQTQALVDMVKNIVNMLSYVLIAFVAISLVVSSIMISIITYISVLERTKEIGILRAIGASKRDVVRVFRAETIIEGLVAGVIGVVVSWLLCLAVNGIVSALAKIDNITSFSIWQALILILISVVLTVFAGSYPARRASKKDPVEALRSE